MSRIHCFLLGCTVLFTATTPSLAQSLFQPTPLQNDTFRPSQSPPTARPAAPVRPAATVRPAPNAAAAKPTEAPLRASISQSTEPTFDSTTYDRINAAMLSYATIEVRGGWPRLPAGLKAGPGATGPDVALLRRRLAISDDLPAELEAGDAYDQVLVEAVKRFQA